MFAKRLEMLLTEAKKNSITAQNLADTLGVKKSRITDWKKGRCSPTPDVIAQIAKFFNVPADYLLKPDDEDPHAIDTKNFGNNNTIITGHHNTTEVNNTQQSGATNPPVFSATTPEEAELLQLYRSLTPAQRSAFLTLAKTLK